MPTPYINDSVLSMDGTFGLSAHIGNSPALTACVCYCDASSVSSGQIMERMTFLDFAHDSFKRDWYESTISAEVVHYNNFHQH